MEFYRFVNVADCYFILITTASRLYQFVGKTNSNEERPILLQIFNIYLNIPGMSFPARVRVRLIEAKLN